MRHEEVREALDGYLEGDVGSAERRRVDEHLSVCASCRAEHRELRATLDLLRGLPDPEPPASFVPELLRRLESEPGPRPGGAVARGLRAILEGPLPVSLAALAAGFVVFAVAGPRDWLVLRDASGPPAPLPYQSRVLEGALSRTEALEARLREGTQAPGGVAARRHAPSAPPVVIPASELEPVAMDPAGGRRALERWLAMPSGVGASAAPDADAEALLPPRPSLAACAAGPTAPGSGVGAAAECRPWLQGMLALGQYDPRSFLAEVEALPEPERGGWLAELARFSHESRTAEGIASRLRATPDARAAELARWFEGSPGEPGR